MKNRLAVGDAQPQDPALPVAGTSHGRATEMFIMRCRSKNLAAGTIAWYRQVLKTFSAHTEGRVLGGLSALEIREYLGARMAAGTSSETVFREWGALKCFFGFLHREGVLPQDPMARVERPRRERRLIKPLDMVGVRRLLDQAAGEAPKAVEDRAMMLLMVDSGLRLSEVLGLEVKNIYWREGFVIVLGKGRKERPVPIGRTTSVALEKHLALRGSGGTLVFVGNGGRRHTPKCVQSRMRNYGQAAGISGVRMSPHTLRHTFAIHYIRNGGDAFSLQKILGHSTLDMVRNYVNLAQRDVSLMHRKYSPMDRPYDATASPAPQQDVDVVGGGTPQ